MTDLTHMAVEVTARFEAPVDRVWELLTDVQRMAGLGPEHFAAHWITPGPAVGATFQGSNRIGRQEWDVICVVTACRPPSFVEWTVGEGDEEPSSTWSYELTPEPDGSTTVVQRFRHGTGVSGVTVAVERHPDRADEIVRSRSDTLRTDMAAVLAAAGGLLAPPGVTGP